MMMLLLLAGNDVCCWRHSPLWQPSVNLKKETGQFDRLIKDIWIRLCRCFILFYFISFYLPRTIRENG